MKESNLLILSCEIKPIPGYEGLYSASIDGRVYSHRSNKFMCLKQHKNGYWAVTLTDSYGEHHDHLVHRLVCLTFHGAPRPKQTDVNHIDANKSNNAADNLEWCTRSENMMAAISAGLMSNQRKAVSESNRRRARRVIGSDASGLDVVSFDSVTLARQAGYAKVSDVLLGRRKTAGGLIWRYA